MQVQTPIRIQVWNGSQDTVWGTNGPPRMFILNFLKGNHNTLAHNDIRDNSALSNFVSDVDNVEAAQGRTLTPSGTSGMTRNADCEPNVGQNKFMHPILTKTSPAGKRTSRTFYSF